MLTVGFMFLGDSQKTDSENLNVWIDFLNNQQYNCHLVSHPIKDPRKSSDEKNLSVYFKGLLKNENNKVSVCRNWTPTRWGDSTLVKATLMMMEDLKDISYVFLVDSNTRPLETKNIHHKVKYLVDNQKNMIQHGSQWVGLSGDFLQIFFNNFTFNGDSLYFASGKRTVSDEEFKILHSVNNTPGENKIINGGVLDEVFFQYVYDCYYPSKNNIPNETYLLRYMFEITADKNYKRKSLNNFKIYRTNHINTGIVAVDGTKMVDILYPGIRNIAGNIENEQKILLYLESCLVKNLYEFTLGAKYMIQKRNNVYGSSPIYTDWGHAQPTSKNLFREQLKYIDLENGIEELENSITKLEIECSKGYIDPKNIDDPFAIFSKLFKPFFWHPLEYVNNTTYDKCPVSKDKERCTSNIKNLYKRLTNCAGKILLYTADFPGLGNVQKIDERVIPLLIMLNIYDEKFKGLTLGDVPEILDIGLETGHLFIRKVIGYQTQKDGVTILEP